MPKRSIVITFGEDDPTIASDIGFLKKLNDLRERYPSWHIRGIVHDESNPGYLPRKPAGSAANRESSHGEMDESYAYMNNEVPTALIEMNEDDRGSDESDGNVIGEAPRCLYVGLRVRMLQAPYSGCTGVVSAMKEDEDRFKVAVDGPQGTSYWWCSPDDVTVLAAIDRGEEAVAVSTVELIGTLQARVAALERELQELRNRKQ